MINFLQSLFSTPPINEVSFEVIFPEKEELKECKIGDSVKLWSPKNRNTIVVFRSGGVGGSGKLGKVPNESLNKVFKIIEGDYTTKIIESEGSKCVIKVSRKVSAL